MHQFPGQALHAAIGNLEKLRCQWRIAQPLGDAPVARLLGQKRTLSGGECLELALHLQDVEENLVRCGLLTSAETVNEFRVVLTDQSSLSAAFQIDSHGVVSRIDEIQRNMRREMKTVAFLHLPSEEAAIYRAPLEGWEAVTARWPRTQVDVSESSSLCFALNRFAASIFHILLVAEFGVIQVGNLLEESGDRPGWGCVERLERILKKPYDQRTPLQQQHSELLKSIVPMIVAVKDSSRHKISHVDNKLVWLDSDLSPQIATEVIMATRGFMRRLAKELP